MPLTVYVVMCALQSRDTLHAGQVDVRADLRPPEPPFGLAIVQSIKTKYYPQHKACSTLKIEPRVCLLFLCLIGMYCSRSINFN